VVVGVGVGVGVGMIDAGTVGVVTSVTVAVAVSAVVTVLALRVGSAVGLAAVGVVDGRVRAVGLPLGVRVGVCAWFPDVS
jgi:hypothetical protein